ncbi:hypothetical protein FHP29_00900 [Nocardioides albidus]|uniref:Uncharacterized protein n=1 Tax=Nocardioides albidus TaxID=1517589 RepID=A0A5C4WQK7_9ACTN|nr:hypothetical protein [Nocardioides albidus]TNM50222.1 hypothetical protein FHP29_00900 [Nocardioides albidus]
MTERLRDLRGDRGAMLVIALIIITTVALVTGALLTKGWTNFRATVSLRGVAGTSYAADTAAKVAINNLRLGAKTPGWQVPSFEGLWDNWVYTNNADGAGCFGATDGPDADTDRDDPSNDLELKNVYPAAGDQAGPSSARVECTPVPGTGIFGGGSGVGIEDPDPTDAFARALTTVGTSDTLGISGVAGHGITVNPLGTGGEAPMPMRGGVASQSFIKVDSGALVTDGYVKANGACSGAGDIIAGVDENNVEQQFCNAPGSVPAPAVPASPLTAVPTDFRDPADYAGTCQFPPGFYNNAESLSDAVNGCTTARFLSGDYYFDFIDEEHGGDNIWEIDTTVIGGDLATPTVSTIPGRCASPINRSPGDGVQFVFGNNSRIEVTDDAHVELCGPTNGGEAPMTIYQQRSNSTLPASPPLTDVPASTVTEKAGNDPGGLKWTTSVRTPVAAEPQAAISAPDASNLAYTVAAVNDDIGLDLQSFAGLSSIPAGADIDSAQLRIKYAKVSAQDLTVTVKDETPENVVVGDPDGSGWGSADIAEQLRTALQDGAFTATTPTIQVRLLNGAVADTLIIDAIQLSVTFTPPRLRATTDVMFINAPAGNFAGEFVVQGATYAPTGFVRLVPGSDDDALVAFRWGLVAMGVDFKAQPSQVFGYPLVSIPDAGTGLGSRTVVVDLQVYVCVEQATCASGGRHVLTARVMITDPPYDTSGTYEGIPEPGQRQIKVLSWAEQN